METTQTLILFTIFNIIFTGLVGGIVIYVIQKKIDATIQKSLFEHQTKFSAIHSKRVETLETLYQKFIIYKTDFENIMNEGSRADFIDEQGKTRLRYTGKEERVKDSARVIL
jgi:hypothetical protein